MGGGNGGGGSSQDAKHVLDSIGQQVYKEKVQSDAETYKDELEGKLSLATILGEEIVAFTDPCELIKDKVEKLLGDNSNRHPCANRSKIRFSDESRSQCTYNRIKDSENNDNKGACAPFRRLSVCDYNLEKIRTKKNRARHNLLLDVCLAANYEAESLINYREQYDSKYHDTGFTTCTMLARSFADIGDIIRGKDLYLGDKKEKLKLEEKLKEIFSKIYDNLRDDLKERTKKEKAKERYKKGDDPNFFKLREDWWTANRETVWKAITCKADDNNRYFRPTCNSGSDNENNATQASHKCRCKNLKFTKDTNEVPTYFDYVPQYLRWFEEWAEDFCRKRKHKLQEAKKSCRGEGNDKYCSRNGYDCTQTVRGINKLVKSEECTKCSVLCTPFVEWIDNKQKEFEKQREKYDKEINGSKGTAKNTSHGKMNNLYVGDFYSKLKETYGTVDSFLGLLNKESTCKGHPKVGKEKTECVDFTKETKTTFSHTEYCETCPLCATKEKQNGEWKNKDYKDQCPIEGLTILDQSKITEIKLLLKDKDGTNIMEKLKSLCGSNPNNKQYDIWKCYYEEKKEDEEGSREDYCIQKNNKENDPQHRKIVPFDVLFPNWINEMLKDSIEWSKELDSCIKKGDKSTCIKGCKKNCECFQKWVEQKKTEWQQIEKHYEKEDFDLGGAYGILEANLKHTYFPIIEEANKEEKPVKEMREIIDRNYKNISSCTRDKNSINDFLQEEKKIATKCLQTQEECQRKKFKNPCSGEIGGDSKRNPLLAQQVAQTLQENAKKLMLERSRDTSGATGEKGDKSVLEGDIKNAKINGSTKSDLAEGKICSIEKKHSNIDTTKAQEPCYNKGPDRLKIATPWKKVEQKETTYSYVIMPPRRQHFCTSNLEHLKTGNEGLSNSIHASHSLLVDVLLAAKSEAQDIKSKYKQNEGKGLLSDTEDKATVCRAMKYSFADIGDIIRGKDMWDQNGEEIKTQKNLVKIFKEIKDEVKKKLPDGIKDKYTDNDKYLELRKDWWEANRDQVWEAMKCEISNLNDRSITTQPNGYCGYSDHTPLDDYIPQRLRWMTEWTEWFCKAQSQAYWELWEVCKECKSKGTNCTESDNECTKCRTACTKYTEKIQKWKPQWKKIEEKYQKLYKKALESANTEQKGAKIAPSGTPNDKDKDVVDFLKKIQEEAKGKDVKTTKASPTAAPNTPYKTAAGYVHQEAHITECQEQREFCEKENGITSKDGKENKKYAFKDTPKDHDYACVCQPKPEGAGRAIYTPRASPHNSEDEEDDSSDEGNHEDEDSKEDEPQAEETAVETKVEDTSLNVCDIVNDILTKPDKFSDACGLKYGKNYGWKCVTPTKPNGDSTGRGVAGKDGEAAKRIHKRSIGESPSDPKSGDEKGSICVPPRRRKLYIGKIKEWATKQNTDGSQSQAQVDGNKGVDGSGNGESGGSEGSDKGAKGEQGKVGPNGDSTSSSVSQQTLQNSVSSTPALTSSGSPSVDPLLAAFVESAAIETFFLWHRYKKEWEAKKKGTLGGTGGDDYSGAKGIWATHSQSGSDGLFGGIEQQALQPRGVAKAGVPLIPGSGMRPQGPPPLGPIPPVLPIPPGFLPGPQPPNNGDSEKGELDSFVGRNGGIPGSLGDSDENQSPQTSLKNGVIPAPFLRQMFYTLADYRDILVGKTPEGIDEVIVSGNKEESRKLSVQEISKIIKQTLEKPNGVTSPSHSGKDPSSWWEQNAKYIWDGMLCALTYKDPDSGQKGGTPTKIEATKGNGTDLFDKLKNQYGTYNSVELKEEEYSGEKPRTSSLSGSDDPINNPKLKDFVEIPPFFRYLHEWGTEFCVMRKKMLGKIKGECKVDEKGKNYCDGEGFECTQKVTDKDESIKIFDYPSCAISCRNYKKWIERKKTQYEKQRDIYQREITNYDTNNYDNGFCVKLKTCTKAADFLNKLGPCKNNKEDEKVNKIFDDKDKTFQHTEYCGPCSEFKIKCNGNGKCSGGSREKKCDGKKPIEANDIKRMGTCTEDVVMRVSDDSKSGKEFEDLSDCQGANIFKGFRKDEWLCGKVCGLDVCGLKSDNGQNDGKKNIILIRSLLKRWVENFLEDYNRIKHKISHCTKNADQPICIKDCGKKCDCVKAWITKKKEEWGKIKKCYVDQYKTSESDVYPVKTILEEGYFESGIKKAIGGCKNLTQFQDSTYCTQSTQNGVTNKKDVVECLLDRLKTKATSCSTPPPGQQPSQTACHNPSHSVETPPDVGDDDSLEEEDQTPEDNTVKGPGFCPETKETKDDEKEKDECKPVDPGLSTDSGPENEKKKEGEDEGNGAAGPEPTTDSTDSIPEQIPVLKPESQEETPPAPKHPRGGEEKKDKKNPKPVGPTSQYTLSDWRKVMSASAFPWTVGVAFVALTYWFLKKKTKSSVDMLRVLQIPQNDYGMPTKLSSNRYVPYRSAQYRGKRYIYLEGDSGTDSGYTDHYSDITSSSESEYEELDINDIYVPHAPKYKTLIEVVLEPSKRETNSGNTIPTSDTPNTLSDIPNAPSDIPNTLSDNTIPTSDIPNAPSDTPPPITDEEWNQLKHDFISNMLQNTQNTEPNNNYRSGDIPTNTNNTTPSRDTLDQKPFIMSIHDRNLLSGEEYNYFMINNSGIYPSSSNRHSLSGTKNPISDNHHPYSGIDLINDSLNSGNQPIDIYDELLKRKENELFGTNHKKHTTSTHSVAKLTNSDPIMNQLELFHKWLDRHRDMCDQWENKVDILNKLKEEWENDNNNNSGNIPSGNITPTSDNTPPNSDIHSGKLSDIHSGKLSDTPSDNNIHSDIHPSDIPSGSDIHPSDIPSGITTYIVIFILVIYLVVNSDIPSGKLSDIPSDNNMHSDIQTSDIPSDNNIHSDIHPSDIPSGKLSDIHSGNKHSDIPSDNNIHSDIHPSDIPNGKLSDIPSDNNIHSDIHPSDNKPGDIPSGNKMLNTNVSIEIDMDNPKTTNEFTYVDSNPNRVDDNTYLDTYPDQYTADNINPNLVGNSTNPVDSNTDNSSMDTILEDLDKPFNEPYYYDMYDDDIYYDVNDDNNTSTVNPNNMEKPSKVKIELDVNTKLVEEKYPIGDVWGI
ncbi:erythrocyte membrane protein 1, EMP1 [Plasmodium reichenowi]|uniref:Erythrocyte membrane protein 1, EMP1 n=1 Tax=Plasmodium reichenowi TaxID=5854 RepID=A0A060RLZ5_PLARE|nr:erythrocyte membrane protein 1, EMP1 [Plasmodium reichenowi]